MYKAGGNDHHARDFLELEKCVEASSLASTPYHASHSRIARVEYLDRQDRLAYPVSTRGEIPQLHLSLGRHETPERELPV
jgi:hypothetical protein